MAPVRLAIALVAFAGCVHQDQSVDPYFPEPTMVAGPPGGGMDPAWNAGYPAGDSGNPAAYGDLVASADPSDPGYVMGTVTDVEIDATLEGYGEWVQVDGYGDVWRPYATEVGLDFTPYETCGSWVWTDDWGWVYGCDWEWGWLPFHYGQWGWFDDYWAWVPDYEWSPAWVEWRGGGGYVGWRPQGPIVRDHRHHHNGPIVRDHRTHHATQSQSQWRFAAYSEFGKRNIRAHLMKNPAEGIAATQLVPRPPIQGTVQPVKAASIMQDRLAALRGDRGYRRDSQGLGVRPAALDGAYVSGMGTGRVSAPYTPSFGAEESDDNAAVFAPGAPGTEGSGVRGGTSGAAIDDSYEGDMRSGGPSNARDLGHELDPSIPAVEQPDPSRDINEQPWQPAHPGQPSRDAVNAQPAQTWQPAQPARDSWTPPSQTNTWQPAQPARDTPRPSETNTWQPAQPSRDSWTRPSQSQSWQPAQPSRDSWTRPSQSQSWQPAQPSRDSWTRPSQSQSWTPQPSHTPPPPPRPTWTPSSSTPSRSFSPSSPPSRSFSPSQSSSWTPSHSSSSSSSSPSRSSSSSSWSSPARSSSSSSSSSSSHSSGSFSAPSRSSSPPAHGGFGGGRRH
jgi:hypothetical protein